MPQCPPGTGAGGHTGPCLWKALEQEVQGLGRLGWGTSGSTVQSLCKES